MRTGWKTVSAVVLASAATIGALVAYGMWWFNRSVACDPKVPCDFWFRVSEPSWCLSSVLILVVAIGVSTLVEGVRRRGIASVAASLSTRVRLWLGANAVGAVAFLAFARALWVTEDELRMGYPGGPGDAFYWLGVLVPIELAFLVVNAVALGFALRSARRHHTWTHLGAFAFVAATWSLAKYIDYVRAFRFITVGI